MRVLVACEESQEVCKAFRERGHEAYSADIQEPSGGHPEWHILGDVIPLIDGDCKFTTMDGTEHEIAGEWDLLIAHPPCTDLAVSGARWFKEKQADGRQQRSIEFFMKFANAKCSKIAIENPVCIISSVWRKPDQTIQPYQFGHLEQKKTCLWLKGLPKLCETENVYKNMMKLPEKKRMRIWHIGSGHAKERSKTFSGIARAFAEQWGKEE